ncbi:hypothetical protein [Natrinema soli]|uniref:Uncharacterized protein n=1 Tax=Natrinema soli TaxID=1930624 RepID=A0ABD5SV63_9EURY|nr:hypothetical protein [Natrinema soli]
MRVIKSLLSGRLGTAVRERIDPVVHPRAASAVTGSDGDEYGDEYGPRPDRWLISRGSTNASLEA